jgi:hypothetical protein
MENVLFVLVQLFNLTTSRESVGSLKGGRAMKKTTSWMYMALVFLSASLGYSGIVRAVETTELDVQKTWFVIGYSYAEATEPNEVQQIVGLLRGASAEELVPQFEKWAKGEVEKTAVRGSLMAFLASKKGVIGLSACRLGEWIYALQDAYLRCIFSILLNDEVMFFKTVEEIMVLTAQAQEFIDVLSQYAPAEVIQALTEILGARHNLTFTPIFEALGKDLPPGKIDELVEKITEAFANVLSALPDWIKRIKTAYGLK